MVVSSSLTSSLLSSLLLLNWCYCDDRLGLFQIVSSPSQFWILPNTALADHLSPFLRVQSGFDLSQLGKNHSTLAASSSINANSYIGLATESYLRHFRPYPPRISVFHDHWTRYVPPLHCSLSRYCHLWLRHVASFRIGRSFHTRPHDDAHLWTHWQCSFHHLAGNRGLSHPSYDVRWLINLWE